MPDPVSFFYAVTKVYIVLYKGSTKIRRKPAPKGRKNMKNIFHRLSFIRIVIAAFLAVVVPYYAHAAATITLDSELQIRSESDELALEKTSLEYNSDTGFYDTDNSKYVTIYNKDLEDYSLFWCWDNSASGASDYFDYKKCSPYSVGIIIPSRQNVSTITLRLYKQATDFNWIRISYDTNGGTHDAGYNNYYTWPRFCTNQATCTMPNPGGVFVRSGYNFDGWDASALHSTLTGAGAIAAGGTLGGQYITVKKDVTIKATWELAAIKANVTIDMNGSVSNPPNLLGDCTSVSCYTPYDAPTRYGYNFIGWMVSVNGVVTDNNLAGTYEDIVSVIPDDSATSVDVVLTAQWDPKDVLISYACSTDGEGELSYTLKFDENFTVLSKEDSNNLCPKENYDIAYWQYNDDRYDLGATYNIDSLGYQLLPVYVYKPANYTGNTITYDCDEDNGGSFVIGLATEEQKQTVKYSEKYTVKPKICYKPGFKHTGWEDADGQLFDFYTEYEYGSYEDVKLTARYTPDQQVDCEITFTSQYDATNMPADMILQTGSELEAVQVPMLTSGFDKRFDGWSYYDSEHNMWFKYFDLDGDPVRSLDYDHCTKGMELQAQWVEANNCTKKDIYTYPDDKSPVVRTVYYSVVEDNKYATGGQIYSDAGCDNPVAITESDLANIIPANSTYNGIYGHYNVAGAGSTTDIVCIRTNGDFANVEYCRREYGSPEGEEDEEDMIWYVKYTCNNGFEERDGQCGTVVYFDGNAGAGAAASGGAAYSEQIMYYGQPLPEISRDTTPTLAGYKFMGWYDGPDYATSTQYYDANEQRVAEKTWNKNTDTATLYAGWQPVVYTVIYDCGAGTLNGDNADTATWNREFIVAGPGRCSLANHVLTGWDAMPENTTNVLDTHPVAQKIPAWSYGTNMKFVAKYATQTDIDFDNNGGIGGEMGLTPDPVIATYGLALPEISPNNPTREGYTFTGWYDKNRKKYYNVDATPAVDAWDKPDAKVTLYAGWAGDKYNVTYDCTQYASDYNPYDQVEATLGEPYTLAPSDRCLRTDYNIDYNLNQWVLTLENGTEVKFTPGTTVPEWTYIGDVTLVAEWTTESVIYFDLNGGTGGQTEPVPVTFGGPTPEISISIPTKTGYDFKGWRDGTDRETSKKYYDETNQVVVPTWDKKDRTTYLYADWEAKTYEVTYDCGDGELYGDETVKATYDSDFIIAGADRCQKSNNVLSEWEIMKSYNNEVLDTYKPGSKISPWKYETDMKLRAKYATQTEITFHNNGGDGGVMGQPGVTSTATYGWVLPEISPDNPTRTGYQFIGWYDGKDYATSTRYYNADATPAVDAWDKEDANVTLYAGWKANTTIVSFNPNGGSGNKPTQITATYGATTPTLSDFTAPTREGYTFTGWYDVENKQYYLADGKPVNDTWNTALDTLILYAGWTEQSVTTTVTLVNGDADNGSKSFTYKDTDDWSTVTLQLPSIDGYEFGGYYQKPNCDGTQHIDSGGKLVTWGISDTEYTMYACWTANTTTVSFNLNGGSGNKPTQITATYDATTPTLSDFTAPTRTGHQFMGWYDGTNYATSTQYYDASGKPTVPTWNKTDATTTLYAGWKANTTIVSFDLNDGSGTAPKTVTATYEVALPNIDATTPTRTGYEFMGWYDGTNYATSTQYYDASGKPTASPWDKTDANVTLYAGWKARQVTITFVYNDYATERTYPVDKSVILPTFTELGWTTDPYSNWYGWKLTKGIDDTLEVDEGDTVKPGFIDDAYMQNQNIIATPLFETILYTTLHFFESEEDSTHETLDTICTNQRCVLPINKKYTKTGHMFDGWDVRGEGNLAGLFKANDDLAEYIAQYTPETLDIYVNWMPETYRLSYSCGNNTPSNIPAGTVTFGDTYTLPNDGGCTATGSKQKGWIINNVMYDLGAEFVWDIDLGIPDTQYTIMPAWEDFWETTLVAYMDNDSSTGRALDAVVCNSKTCILPENIYDANEKQGYTFNGWSVDGIDGIVSAGDNIAQYINADTPKRLKIVAQWEPNEYTLTYHCGDGNGTPPAPQPIKYNTWFAFAQNTCTKDGYNFAGWDIESEIGHPAQNAGWHYTSDMMAVAIWEQNTKFVVTLNPNGGSGGTQSVNVTYNEIMPNISNLPTRQYYDFQGFVDEDGVYYYNAAGTAIKQWPVLGNGVLTAVWEPYTFTATYNCGDGSNPPHSQSARYGEEFTLAENTCTRDGYKFAGWTIDGESVPNSFEWKFTAPTEFTAQWTANSNYTVTLNPDNGTTRVQQLSNVVFDSFMSDVEIPTRTGYVFDGYYYDDVRYFDNMGHCVRKYNVPRDSIMLARWTPKQYTAMYDCDNGTDIQTVPQPISYGSSYTLSNSGICTKSGYTFAGWQAAGTNNIIKAGANILWQYDNNTTFVAQWDKKIYTAYIQYDGNGADGGDNPEKPSKCTSGTPCYLPVNTFTKTGYAFKKWKVTYGTRSYDYSADTDISGLIISDNQTLNVTAQWTPIEYTVSYDANGGNSTLGKTICTIEGCNPVTNDNIGTYMTRAGYIFKNWTTDTKTGVIANLSNGIRQDTTLYAMWNACPVGTFKTADVSATTACTSCVTLSDDDTNTNYERTGAPASTSANDCIAQCKPIELRGGIAKPTQASVKFPAKCEYTGVSINGNTCEINFELGTCVETECRMGYELVKDQCVKCPDENAIAYHKKNSCDIKQCVPGYHVDVNNLRQCVPNAVDCTADINNAVAATKVWDDNRRQYGICTPIECDYDHHIEDGQCLPDEKQCELAHGSGHQEWNYRTNTWSECIVDQCDPGYTNDPTLTDDKDYAQCGRCANTYDKQGNVAASSFVQECEIATCMYQGQKYILTADNECMSVCENLSDETGEMWWDNATKTCKRVCAPGYKQWN